MIAVPPAPTSLVDFLQAKGTYKKKVGIVKGKVPTGERNQRLTQAAGSLRRQGYEQTEIAAALKSLNAAACIPPLSDVEVEQIAESIGKRAASGTPVFTADMMKTVAQFRATTPTGTDFLIEGLLPRGAIVDLVADAKAGKSTLSIAAVAAVLKGQQFLGHKTSPGGVVYLSEERPATLREKFDDNNVTDDLQLSIVELSAVRNVSWPETMAGITTIVKKTKAVLLVIDTHPSFALRGKDECAAGDVQAAMAPVEDFVAETGATVWILRHSRKSGGDDGVTAGRGSSAHAALCDVVMFLTKHKFVTNRRHLTMQGRFADMPSELMIEWTRQEGHRLVRDQALFDLLVGVVDANPGGTMKDIIAAVDNDAIADKTVENSLPRLVRQGRLKRVGAGTPRDPYRYFPSQSMPTAAVSAPPPIGGTP